MTDKYSQHSGSVTFEPDQQRERAGYASTTKPSRQRGRNRPQTASRRYRWKEAIFGRGYPDLCALREGQPYRASQEARLDADKSKGVRLNRRGTLKEPER